MDHPLKKHFGAAFPEAGCDEAGRGCLAGPVMAAAVILPRVPDLLLCEGLMDSKRLSAKERQRLRDLIRAHALSYGVASVDHHTIDEINILNASILAMHMAIKQLQPQPALILADGNRFSPYGRIPHHCLVKGDATYLSIAAASILAKTSRDAYMAKIHREHPQYGWDRNKGYPTPAHREAIALHGLSPYHRRSFRCRVQWKLGFTAASAQKVQYGDIRHSGGSSFSETETPTNDKPDSAC